MTLKSQASNLMTYMNTAITPLPNFKSISDYELPNQTQLSAVFVRQIRSVLLLWTGHPHQKPRLHSKVLIFESDRTPILAKLIKPSLRSIWFRKAARGALQRKRAISQDHGRLPSHLTNSRYVQGRNRDETIYTRRKVESENNIAGDAKHNKKRLFAFAE